MWCSVVVISVVLGVAVCSEHTAAGSHRNHHWPPGRLRLPFGSLDWHRRMNGLEGGLGPREEPNEKVRSLVGEVQERFKKLIEVQNINTVYRPEAFMKEGNGSLYFIKVKGDGPDGKVIAILRVQGTEETLQGYVLIAPEEAINFTKNGTNVDDETRLAAPSTELPVTKKVKEIVVKFRPMFYSLIVENLLYLVDSKAALDVISYKHQGASFQNYWIKVRSQGADTKVNYIAMRISKKFGGVLHQDGIEIMNPYEEIPEVQSGKNLNKHPRKPSSGWVSVRPIVAVIMTSYVAIYIV